MIKTFAKWILKDELGFRTRISVNRAKKVESLEKRLLISQNTNRKILDKMKIFKELLANKNAKCTVAQSLMVTNHALSRYRSRIGYGGDDESLRRMIYKQTISHLSTLDKLEDGKYEIANNAIVRVKDNTVCTVTPRTGSGKRALASNRSQQRSRDKYNSGRR